MKNKRILILLLPVVLLLNACKPREHEIMVKNPLTFDRQDEPVILQRQTIEKWFGKIPEKWKFLLLQGKDTLPSQCDDTNGDGKWDELFFLCSISASDSISLRLVRVEKTPLFQPRNNIRMAKIVEMFKKYEELDEAERIKGTDTKVTSTVYQLEGPGWENDRVAFRNYLDERNGMDIFGKVTDTMVLDYIGRGDDYHSMGPWGMDILKVGNSLGAGGIAVLHADTLVRGGIPSKGGYHLLFEGPLRSRFRLLYEDWIYGNRSHQLIHDISIWGGWYGYESCVTLSGEDTAQLAAGIVNLHSDSLYILEDNPEYVVLATFDHQAFNGELLGMALIVPREKYQGYGKAPENGHDVVSTWYAKLKADAGAPVIFRFYACWELSDIRFTQLDSYLKYLQEEALRMSNPLVVSERKK